MPAEISSCLLWTRLLLHQLWRLVRLVPAKYYRNLDETAISNKHATHSDGLLVTFKCHSSCVKEVWFAKQIHLFYKYQFQLSLRLGYWKQQMESPPPSHSHAFPACQKTKAFRKRFHAPGGLGKFTHTTLQVLLGWTAASVCHSRLYWAASNTWNDSVLCRHQSEMGPPLWVSVKVSMSLLRSTVIFLNQVSCFKNSLQVIKIMCLLR